MDFLSQFTAARRVSTPLIAIRTFDPAASLGQIRAAIGPERWETDPIIKWDCVHGFRAVNPCAHDEIAKLLDGGMIDASADAPNAVRMAENAGQNVTVIFDNIHLYFSGGESSAVIQGFWNLRDCYKPNGNTAVLLLHPGAALPVELTSDTLLLDEPLPTADQLRQTVLDIAKYADLPELGEDIIDKATDALIGLPMFPAEQSVAMSIDRKAGSIDIPELWAKKREVISQTPGLNVWEAKQGLDAIGGLQTIKTFIRRVMTGREAPKAIIFTDEIEKAFAGSGTDLSGVKTELTGSMLSWTQDRDMDGILLLGVPGGGKSQVTKNAGFEFDVPVINFDLAAMQGGIIGQSGANLRAAQKTVDAIAGGRVLWIGTCNSIQALPAELRDRFKLGTFFVDTPDKDERAAIWDIYRALYSVPAGEPIPADEGWTGRQIRECCLKAYRLKMTLAEAASYVVPLTQSAPEQIETLRAGSSGKYLSASHPGLYTHHTTKQTAATIPTHNAGRVIRFEDK